MFATAIVTPAHEIFALLIEGSIIIDELESTLANTRKAAFPV
jgi:hypothetical protein